MSCMRLQLYNRRMVTLSSSSSSTTSSSSPLFILVLCEQTAGLILVFFFFFFFCKSYHYSSLQAQELHSKLLMEARLAESEVVMRLHWGCVFGEGRGVGCIGLGWSH